MSERYDFQLVTMLGYYGFFENCRIPRDKLPDGLYAYDIIHGVKEDESYFAAVVNLAETNHVGTFVTDVDLHIGPDESISLDENSFPNFSPMLPSDLNPSFAREQADRAIEGFMSLDEVADWLTCHPNATWKSPVTVEVKGLSTFEAYHAAKVMRDALLDAGFSPEKIRCVLPFDNIGITRWSVDDIAQSAEDPLTPTQMRSAIDKVEAAMSDTVVEMGWNVIEAAVDNVM